MDYNILYRQKDKGWQYIISYKQDERWKQKSKQGFRTRALAKKASDERLNELKNEFIVDLSTNDKGITFLEFKERYLNNIVKYREANTIKTYRETFDHFSKLNPIPMQEIKYMHIQECVDEMLEKPNLKIKTIKLYISRIKSLFNKATKKPYKLIMTTPLDEKIDLPEEKEEIEKAKALTKLELEKVLSVIKSEKDYLICLIAATCGLRIGEIIGLTWGDIDEINNKLSVNKQWKRLKDGLFGFGTVKRKNSNRIVPIPQNTLNVLLKYKKNNPTDIKNKIFLDNSPQNVSYRIYKKLNNKGLDVTMHDLRHTYATMLVASGVDFKTVAQLMGHDVEMTIKTYSHVTEDMIKKVTDTVNFIF